MTRATTGARRDAPVARRVYVLGQRNPIVVSGGRDARVAAICAQQRGRVAFRQLRAAGLSSAQVARLVAAARLFVLLDHVYATGHPGPVPWGEHTAALLAVRPGSLLSGAGATRLWGLTSMTASDDDGGPIEILTDARWSRPKPGIVMTRSRWIAAPDRRVRLGLPVVSPARALLESAVELGARGLERAYDQALVTGLARVHDVAELVHRVERHPGRPMLLELVQAHLGPTVTRSQAEETLLALIRAAELPMPQVNARLFGFEVDFHWPHARLVVEVDGYRYHSSRRALERDHLRDRRLQEQGIMVLRVSWRRLELDSIAVVAEIARLIERRWKIAG